MDSPRNNRDSSKPLGSLNSVSEPAQIGLIVMVILMASPAWFSTIPPIVTILRGLALLFSLYVVAHHLPFVRSTIRFYEDHFEFEKLGNKRTVDYDQLGCLTTDVKDHHFKGAYLMSKIKLRLDVEGPVEAVQHEFDFRWESGKEKRLRQFLDLASEGIENRLASRLEAEGEIMWMPNAYLTMDGIKLMDDRLLAVNGKPEFRFFDFEEIEEWKLEQGQFKVWKKGDALPSLVLNKSTPNFRPLLGLFHQMWEYFEQSSTCDQPIAEISHAGHSS